MNKLKNTDWTKIAFFIVALPFLVSGLVLAIKHGLDADQMNVITGVGFALITKGVFLLGFGFSRNGTKSHQNSMKTEQNEIKQAIKDIQNHNKRQDEKIKSIDKNMTKMISLLVKKGKQK